jgi:tRNA 2-thiouridine synthesizing protein A
MNANPSGPVHQQTADRYLDCKGLACPLPIVRISRTVKEMSCGQTLLVEAVDPAFRSDLEAWVRTMGHELLEFSEGPIQWALIKKSPLPGEVR